MKSIASTNYQAKQQQMLSVAVLKEQNKCFMRTGGRSQENRSEGFRPAFSDTKTGTVYPSCFADGRPAPMHMLDGLPSDVVVARNESGRVISVKDSVIAGFVKAGQFYTREQAAAAVTTH